MEINFNLLSILFLLGTGQGVFLALSLLTARSGDHGANRYLALLILLFAASLLDGFLVFSGLSQVYPWLHTLLWPKEFFHGPLIYFYVRELTHASPFSRSQRQWLHFLPAALHIGFSWSLLGLSVVRQRAILEDRALGWPDAALAWVVGDFEAVATLLSIGIYLYLSLGMLRRYALRLGDTFSYTDRISLDWLRIMLLAMSGLYGLYFFQELLSGFFDLHDGTYVVLHVAIAAVIYLMGYLGLRQPAIFAPRPAAGQPSAGRFVAVDPQVTPAPATGPAVAAVAEPAVEDEDNRKYRKSSLTADLSRALYQEVCRRMEERKLHLDSKLSLPQLAETLEVSPNYLSQAINEQSGQNFFDFINGYRVAEARDRLLDPRRQGDSILTVAMDAGFNSKTAFYTAFKRHTGLTPGEFKRNPPAGVGQSKP